MWESNKRTPPCPFAFETAGFNHCELGRQFTQDSSPKPPKTEPKRTSCYMFLGVQAELSRFSLDAGSGSVGFSALASSFGLGHWVDSLYEPC